MYAPAKKPKTRSFCQVMLHFVHPAAIAAFAMSAGTLNVMIFILNGGLAILYPLRGCQDHRHDL
jgi:hypothetical protein